jgi:hypothetical protein
MRTDGGSAWSIGPLFHASLYAARDTSRDGECLTPCRVDTYPEETVFDDDDPFYTEISNFVDAINGAAGQDATLYTYDGAMSW